jgi:drug/metabolite transporter (DMT)-like permease
VWIIYALLSAFSLATADAVTKKGLERADVYLMTWVRFLFALPFLGLVLPFIEIPSLDATFWIAVSALVPLELLAAVLYIHALKLSPLSLSIPFLAFTPVFLIGTGFLLLGEMPTLQGAGGILLIATGGYLLHAHTLREGILSPLRAMMREPGSLLMLTVAGIFSVTSGLGKLAILHSGPIFFGVVYYFILAGAFTPLAVLKTDVAQAGSRWPLFLLIGLFDSIMMVTHVLAISETQASYMIAVKRLSLLFSVAYGYWMFNESHVVRRLLGSLLMVAGVTLIATSR